MAVKPSSLKHLPGYDHLSFLHVNARSLESKHDEFELFLASTGVPFDIIMVSETWYTKYSVPFAQPGYQGFALNRSQRKGGGVLLLAKAELNVSIIDEFSVSNANFEVLSVRSRSNIFCVVYRPPDANIHTFFCFLEEYFDFIRSNKYSLFLAGDFNIDMLKTSRDQIELSALLQSNGFVNTIVNSTRITHSSNTLIDLFITNTDRKNLCSGSIASDMSDHLPIFTFIENEVPTKRIIDPPQRFQDINSASLDAFRNEVEAHDWRQVFRKHDSNSMYETFIAELRTLYNKHFPYVVRHRSNKSRKPWLTNYLRSQIKVKNNLYWVFIRTRNPETWKKFKSFRNRLNATLKKAKEEYFFKHFSVAANTELLWKRLNAIVHPKTDRAISSLCVNGLMKCGSDLSNALNDHFIAVGQSGACNVNPYPIQGTSSPYSSMVFFPTTESEVVGIFRSLKTSRSLDANDMQIRPIKHIIDIIAPILTTLYNLVLESSCFPEKMQTARVIAIHKGGDENDLGNFRPISILPILSKGLEKIIHARLVRFLNKHSFISLAQYGFLKGKSTEQALLAQKECIIDAFEDKNIVLGVYIDFSKAFDCVQHNLLLYKLEHYGVRGRSNDLLRSYLRHRSQFVTNDTFDSKTKRLKSGVPQGSILGPLLFIVYINDIFSSFTNCKWVGYADDTALFFSGVKPDGLVSLANDALAEVSAWSKRNSLKINTKKTQAIIFRTRNRVIELTKKLYLDNDEISVVREIKALGVTFTETLSWNKHVQNVCNKLNSVTALINKNRQILPVKAKRLIYNGLFLSTLNYCHLVWGTTSSDNLKKLGICQKRAIRAIANVPYATHTAPYFEAYNILKVKFVYAFRLSCTYRLAMRTNNTEFISSFRLARRHYTYDTRSQDDWIQPICRTNYGNQSVSYQLAVILNKYAKHGIATESASARTFRSFLSGEV